VIAITDRGQSESWLARNGWLLAATWLVFLVFPWFAIATDEDLASTTKVAATLLMVAFAAVYVDGFRRQFSGQLDDGSRPRVVERSYTGRVHVAALLALGLTLFVVAGPAALGVMSFIVVFSVFHFAWPIAWTALIGGTLVTFLVPLATNSFGDVWFMALIVLSVGFAAVLIRILDAAQSRQVDLRTQLAVSDERNRVARDVHDVLGHSLTAVILKAELCHRLLDGVDPDDASGRSSVAACREQLGELRDVSRSALAEIRTTVGGLRATDLADEVTVARTVLADAGVELLVTGDAGDVPEQHRSVLAWVVREAVTNVVRHADASRCHIALLAPSAVEPVVLRVSDDGKGLATTGESLDAGVSGNGLRGVRERVDAAGGDLKLRSDDGTTIEVTF